MAAQARNANHLDAIDGLRGVAIGLVLMNHAWLYHEIASTRGSALHIFNTIAEQGYQGVSLFLALSGFCLSYHLLMRRQSGNPRWFLPSEFFAKRIVRIIPPYYIALLLSILLLATIFRGYPESQAYLGGIPGGWNILAHILLIQNLTSYSVTINGPFWSLGLEWQWYLIYPAILLSFCARKLPVVLLALLIGVGWTLLLHPFVASITSLGLGDLIGRAALPSRLFEFLCGMIAAYIVVEDFRISIVWLYLGLLVPPFLVQVLPEIVQHKLGLTFTQWAYQPLYGILFAALILLAVRSPIFNKVLAAAPLARLGVISYSVYLIHQPIVLYFARYRFPAYRNDFVVIPFALTVAILSGTLFYQFVERPLTQGRFRNAMVKWLQHQLGWMEIMLKNRELRLGLPARETSAIDPSACLGFDCDEDARCEP